MPSRILEVRVRAAANGGVGEQRIVRRDFDPAKAAVVICDMWDAHHCASAARRVREMASRINEVAGSLRAQGTLIIHSPGDCVEYYSGTAARQRATEAPFATAAKPFRWNIVDASREAILPSTLGDPGPCSCESAEPCCEAREPYPWTRQTPLIEIAPDDAVSDDGQEVFNLLQQYGRHDVILMGVHANVCVLARSYGIRQLVYLKKSPLLCRELTDSFHRDPRGHRWGHEQVIAHIEAYWCGTVTSDQLLER